MSNNTEEKNLKDKSIDKAVTTISKITLIVAILLSICAVYWIIQALAYGNVNILMLFISIVIPLIILYYRKRQ